MSIPLIGLLSSWATVAESLPSDAIFSMCSTCRWARPSSVGLLDHLLFELLGPGGHFAAGTAQVCGHLVESLGQPCQLVVAAHLDAGIEVAVGDPPSSLVELSHRALHHAPNENRRHHADDADQAQRRPEELTLGRMNGRIQGRHRHLHVEHPQYPFRGRMGVAGRRCAARLVADDRQMAEHLAPAPMRTASGVRARRDLSPPCPGGNYGRSPSRVRFAVRSLFHGRHHDEAVLVVDPDAGDLGRFRKPHDGCLHLLLAVQEHAVVSCPFDERTGSVDVGFDQPEKVFFDGGKADYGVNR